jgi:putative salt-induced outer membrane protein YdiY
MLRPLAFANQLLLALVLLAPTHAMAQVEAPPSMDEELDRWDFTLDLGFNGSRGNTRLTVLTSGFRVKHLQTDLFELELGGALRYGESEGHVVARNLKGSFTADYRPQDRWSPFVYTLAERDAFRKLDVRTDAGAGVKYTITQSDLGELSISAAALHNREVFTEPFNAAGARSRADARWSVRARGSRKLGDVLRVDHTTFYKPVWDDGGDYDVDMISSLNVRVSERVGFKFSHSFRRDSTPPSGITKNDQLFQAGITVEL